MLEQKLMTAARKIYALRYSPETEVNSKFKLYVCNYKAAFEGRNTQRHQLVNIRKKKGVSKTRGREIKILVIRKI